MSTIAAGPESTRALPLVAWLERRGVMVSVAVSALVVAAGGGMLLATSPHLVHPTAYAIEFAVLVVLTVWAALYWAVRRPGNRIALVLLTYAAATAGLSLQGATSPLLHSVGVLIEILWFLLAYYLVFAFPEGRLVGALERLLFAPLACTALASFLPWFFFSPVVSSGAPQGGCTATCPSNPLMIDDRPGIASGFGKAEDYFAALVGFAMVAFFLYRLARSSRPRRRALVPVYVPALLLSIPFTVFRASTGGLITLGSDGFNIFGWFLTAGRISLSLGFLVAIWQAMLFAAVALETILRQLRQEEDAAHLRALVAEALDDPSLELGLEIAPGTRIFVDSRGNPLDRARADVERSVTAIRRGGDTLAFMVHDPALATDPELVQAAGRSVVLALESGRLESELQSRTAELQTSRARIVETAARERLRLERDLHDGAQQRLMAIQGKLALAQELPPGEELAEQLEAIQADAAAAVEELRTLAHGIYPSVLRERGVADALRSLAMTASIPIEVSDAGLGRCSAPIEGAIYFCSVEAIQNAIKHAGPGVHVSVALGRRGEDIHFTISDNGVGVGKQPSGEGVGLTSMRDRIGALGGWVGVSSQPGRGTRVRGTVPANALEFTSIEGEHA